MKSNDRYLEACVSKIRVILAAVRSRYRAKRPLFYLSLIVLAPLPLIIAFAGGTFSPLLTTYSTVSVVESASPEKSIPTISSTDIPLLKSLEERKALLDAREKALEIREKELRILEQQLEEKISTLALLRKEVGELIQEKEAFEEKRLEHLIKVYEGMKPEEAAPLIERLKEDTAVILFYRMKEKKVSQILGFVNPDVAAKISERLAAQQKKDEKGVPKKEKL